VMSAATSTALFEVDGTLVDSNYLHAVAWWEAFGQAGHDVPMAAIHRAVGMGSDKLLGALLPEDRDDAADGGIRAAHKALYGTLRACRAAGVPCIGVRSGGTSGAELREAGAIAVFDGRLTCSTRPPGS
jgi:phosphoglycolate phosphatase-like HAD superfamily hydrolase